MDRCPRCGYTSEDAPRVENGRLYAAGYEADLTPVEQILALMLAENYGEPVAHGDLYRAAWPLGNYSNALGVNMHRMRRRLAEAGMPVTVRAVRSYGYVLEPVAAEVTAS